MVGLQRGVNLGMRFSLNARVRVKQGHDEFKWCSIWATSLSERYEVVGNSGEYLRRNGEVQLFALDTGSFRSRVSALSGRQSVAQ